MLAKLRKYLIYLILSSLVSCATDDTDKLAFTDAAKLSIAQQGRSVCQIFESADLKYSFGAKVLDIKKVNKRLSGMSRSFPVERLVAVVTQVSNGGDNDELRKGQPIFIELSPQIATCDIGKTCRFVSPRRDTRNTNLSTLLLLEAIIVPGS